MKYSVMKDSVMKFSVPISSLSSRGLKNLFFSFYNKYELLSKATDGNFFVSKDFCYSIGDGVFKEQIIDKIQEITAQAGQGEQVGQGEAQEADENKLQHKLQLLGIRIENRTDDYDGDLVFTGFNQSEEQEQQEKQQEPQEAVQETAAQEDTVQEKAVQEDAVQVANKPNFDPAFENTPTVGTETAVNVDVNVAANNNAVEVATPETPLLTLREQAISTFLDYLVNHCNEVKRIYLEDEDTKNEKFAMRAWFTQLGWRGKEDNELRSYFYDRLEGNTAFRTEEDHARWAARWQPRYFDKHPEMKWVLEETNPLSQRNQIEAEAEPASEPESSESDQHMAEEAEYVAASNLIVPDKTVPDEAADSAEVAEAISATVGTGAAEEVVEEVAQEVAQEAVAQSEPSQTATESEIVAEVEADGTTEHGNKELQ